MTDNIVKHVIVTTQNYWGRGATLAEAQRACAELTGSTSFKAHLKRVKNPAWIETHIETPDTEPLKHIPYCNSIDGGVCHWGNVTLSKVHEPKEKK